MAGFVAADGGVDVLVEVHDRPCPWGDVGRTANVCFRGSGRWSRLPRRRHHPSRASGRPCRRRSCLARPPAGPRRRTRSDSSPMAAAARVRPLRMLSLSRTALIYFAMDHGRGAPVARPPSRSPSSVVPATTASATTVASTTSMRSSRNLLGANDQGLTRPTGQDAPVKPAVEQRQQAEHERPEPEQAGRGQRRHRLVADDDVVAACRDRNCHEPRSHGDGFDVEGVDGRPPAAVEADRDQDRGAPPGHDGGGDPARRQVRIEALDEPGRAGRRRRRERGSCTYRRARARVTGRARRGRSGRYSVTVMLDALSCGGDRRREVPDHTRSRWWGPARAGAGPATPAAWRRPVRPARPERSRSGC